MKLKYSLLGSAILSALFFSASPIFADDARMPVSVEAGSKVPLRVLTRPGATLYADSDGSKILNNNLPTFTSYFVYTRPSGESQATGAGWYEVGSDDKGTVKGWIKGDDVFEWKQTMCLTFSHPDGRSPVLMFEDDEYLESLINMPEEKRVSSVDGYYTSIDQAASSKKSLPKDFPVLSMEPKMSVDNVENFTLMPIIDYKVVEFEGRESRLLDIVAVNSSEKDRKSSDLRTNKDYLSTSTTTSESKANQLKNIKFDVVWVIDTTRSMGPYINKVRESMINISKQLAKNKDVNSRISFGVWGFRDSSTIDGLEYVTKNYTPELQSIDDFVKTMEEVKETKVDSQTFDEDMFSGVNDAINSTNWNDNSVRIVILVGDAPGHKLGHEWNASGMDQETLRAVADSNDVKLYAIHIKPKMSSGNNKKFNKVAASQFKTLSHNQGQDESMFWEVDAANLDSFASISDVLSASIVSYTSNAEAEFTGTGESDVVIPDTAKDVLVAPSQNAIKESLHAAAVTWLGNEANVAPPRDIEAWVSDKDLKESSRQSMEVRLLLTKAQLDAISTLLKQVLEAGETNQVSGEDFFTSLQAASAVAARDPEKMASAGNIAESGLVPDFLKGLPYKSRLMEMNNELWESWGPDEQNAFLSNLEAKINAYAAIHDDTSQWISLNEGDDPNDYVAPILLDLMP